MSFSLQIHQDGGVGKRVTTTTTTPSTTVKPHHASAYNVPAFASGLGMTLEPIKAAAGANATVTLEKVSEHEIFSRGTNP